MTFRFEFLFLLASSFVLFFSTDAVRAESAKSKKCYSRVKAPDNVQEKDGRKMLYSQASLVVTQDGRCFKPGLTGYALHLVIRPWHPTAAAEGGCESLTGKPARGGILIQFDQKDPETSCHPFVVVPGGSVLEAKEINDATALTSYDQLCQCIKIESWNSMPFQYASQVMVPAYSQRPNNAAPQTVPSPTIPTVTPPLPSATPSATSMDPDADNN